jgi:uncharacterized repeat protein (TIGR01451 family)
MLHSSRPKRSTARPSKLAAAFRAAILVSTVAALAAGCGAQPPKERVERSTAAIVAGLGNVTISTAATVVNRYTSLAANAAAGATTLTVASGAALSPVAAGDLLMIMQMQGATIDTTNTATYGQVTALNGAGAYELVTVASVTGNVVTLSSGCGLVNAYSAAAHTQVIWVPQYAALTVSGAGTITAPAWNGATGGVVAIQATTVSVQTAGGINVTGLGFRGGVVKQQTTLPPTGAPAYVTTDNTGGSEKGESIAGFETEYDAENGRYGIGAPANGGGGGGPHNSGGGGGANGNDGKTWTGAGVMPTTVTGASAWAFDPDDIANGGAVTISSGGGRGGYDYSAIANDPTVFGPGNAVWGGDDRQEHGGRGGRPLANSALSAIYFGGGGGAGESNNNSGTSGAPGGGIAFVVANSIDGAGTGSIVANGAAGATTLTSATLDGNDAPGGGGGGGSVVLVAPSVTNLTITANGGAGGNQNITTPPEAEGPGGGGGGGFIAVPASFTATVPTGGAGGVTNSTGVTKFPRNGSTDGAAGQTATIASGAMAQMCIATDLQLTMTDGGGNATPGSTVTYTVTATNNGPNPVTGATVTDTFSSQFTGESWTCAGSACPAASGTGNLNAVLGTLAPGAMATFTVTATVAMNSSGTLSNTATVTAPTGIVDSNLANNTVTITNPLVGSADLGVTITNTPTSVEVGGAYSYDVGVSNTGPSEANGVSVVITIPAGDTFQSATGTGWSCTYSAPKVTCTLAAGLPSGTSAPIVVNVTAPSTPGSGTATVTATATTANPDPANATAMDTIVFGCVLDTDCPSGDWCSLNACTPRLPNGSMLPTVAPINGTCTPSNAARVCLSGACDATHDVCGIELGDGTCATTNQCIAGVCVTSGPNSGKCETCATDTNCATPTPACDTTTNTCVQCTATNTSACTGTTALCSATSTCVGCNGDNGTSATNACPTADPYCDGTGTCTMCTTDTMCTTGTHPGPFCNTTTGACGTSCTTDSECGTGDWCDNLSGAGICQPKVADGDPIPGGTCTTTIANRACVSGTCTTGTNVCGLPPDGGVGDGGVDAGDGGGGDAGDAGDAGSDAGRDSGTPEASTTPDSGPGFDSGTSPDAGDAGVLDDGAVEGGGCSVGPGTNGGSASARFADGALGAIVALGVLAARRRRRAHPG